MYGAIIGDVVGSKYEFNNIKTKDFPMLSEGCTFTDDTVMTIAVARALMRSREKKINLQEILVDEMQYLGKKYPDGSYGLSFSKWLQTKNPKPYNSFGNGSAMRVSPCGLIAVEIGEALSLAKASAEVTHNHPEGIKGAQAVAGAIFLAKTGKTKDEIASFIKTNFYDLEETLEEIRPKYYFNETCQETVPQAIQAFLESDDFEDAIRNAVSLGGDSDTLAAITGSIAWVYYGCYRRFELLTEKDNSLLLDEIKKLLPIEFAETIQEFAKNCMGRNGTYYRVGSCSQIPHRVNEGREVQFTLSSKLICQANGMIWKEKLQKTSTNELIKQFCSDKWYVNILHDFKLGVINYKDYADLCNRISNNPTYLNEASLDECFVYLTYLWRWHYGTGGWPDFDYKHRHEIRMARMRIVNLLFCLSLENESKESNSTPEINSSMKLLEFIRGNVQKYGKIDEFNARTDNPEKPTEILYFVRFKSIRELEEEWNTEIFEKGECFYIAFANAYCDIKKGETPKFKKRVNEEKNDKYSFYECKNEHVSSIVLLDEDERCFYRFNNAKKKWIPDWNLYFEYIGYSSSCNEISEVVCTKEYLHRMGIDTLRGTRFYE